MQQEEAVLEGHVLQVNLPVQRHRYPRRNTGEPAARRRRCTRRRELHMGGGGLTVSHPASATIVVRTIWLYTGLAVWRHKRRQQKQLEAAKVPATEAMQPEPAVETGQGGKVEAAGGGESASCAT